MAWKSTRENLRKAGHFAQKYLHRGKPSTAYSRGPVLIDKACPTYPHVRILRLLHEVHRHDKGILVQTSIRIEEQQVIRPALLCPLIAGSREAPILRVKNYCQWQTQILKPVQGAIGRR